MATFGVLLWLYLIQFMPKHSDAQTTDALPTPRAAIPSPSFKMHAKCDAAGYDTRLRRVADVEEVVPLEREFLLLERAFLPLERFPQLRFMGSQESQPSLHLPR